MCSAVNNLCSAGNQCIFGEEYIINSTELHTQTLKHSYMSVAKKQIFNGCLLYISYSAGFLHTFIAFFFLEFSVKFIVLLSFYR